MTEEEIAPQLRSVIQAAYELSVNPMSQNELREELSTASDPTFDDPRNEDSWRQFMVLCFHRLLQQSQCLYGTEMQLTIPKGTILEIPLNVIQRATSVRGPDAELFRSHRYHKAMRRCNLFAFSDG
jgi:hypothetical protein